MDTTLTLSLQVGFADLERGVIKRFDQELPLRNYECRLLAYLSNREGEAISREELLSQLWGYKAGTHTRTVDATIYSLRKKLERDPKQPFHITSVHGSGYTFNALSTAPIDSDVCPRLPHPYLLMNKKFIGRVQLLSDLSHWLNGPHKTLSIWGPIGIGKTHTLLHLTRTNPHHLFQYFSLKDAPSFEPVFHAISQNKTASNTHTKTACSQEQGKMPIIVLDHFESCYEAIENAIERLEQLPIPLRLIVLSRHMPLPRIETYVNLTGLDSKDASHFLAHYAYGPNNIPDSDSEVQRTLRALSEKLDGIPHLLELAVQSLKLHSPSTVHNKLAMNLDFLLSKGPQNVSNKEELTHDIEKSLSLLSETERQVLQVCAMPIDAFDSKDIAAITHKHSVHFLDKCLVKFSRLSLLYSMTDLENSTTPISWFQMPANIRHIVGQDLHSNLNFEGLRKRYFVHILEHCSPPKHKSQDAKLQNNSSTLQSHKKNLLWVLESAHILAQPELAVSALEKLAFVYQRLGENIPMTQLKKLDSASSFFTQKPLKARLLLLMANTTQGGAESALNLLTQALPFAPSNGLDYAKVFTQRTRRLSQLGRHIEARAQVEEGNSLTQHLKIQSLTASWLRIKGELEFNDGNPIHGLRDYQKAIQIYQTQNQPLEGALVSLLMVNSLTALNQFSEALDILCPALNTLHQFAGPSDIFRGQNARVSLLILTHQVHAAEEQLSQMTHETHARFSADSLGSHANSLAMSHQIQGRISQCRRAYQRALAMTMAKPKLNHGLVTLLLISLAHREWREFQLSAQYLAQATDIVKSMPPRLNEAWSELLEQITSLLHTTNQKTKSFSIPNIPVLSQYERMGLKYVGIILKRF